VIGALSIQDSTREHAYGSEDLKVLTTIAANLGVAIHNARLYRAEQQRRVLAETLQQVNAAITASLRRDEVLGIILEQLRRVVSFDTASIMQWDDQKRLRIEAHIGYQDNSPPVFSPTPENAPHIWKAIEGRTSVNIRDTWQVPAWATGSLIRSWIGIPLIYQDQVTGFLNIDNRAPDAYAEDDVRIASMFADQAAIAIENARLYEKAQFEISHRKQTEVTLREANRSMLQQVKEITALQDQLKEQALRDPVTGLYNRRFLNESLPREIARAEREGIELGVVMMDLDHFKRINDAFGHINGDLALVALGKLMSERTRSSDIACRFGGEEFCLIMPGASLNTVVERAEELRAAFEQVEIETERGSFRVTISLGAAIFPVHGHDRDTLLSRADEALYRAKQAGRNCVMIGTGEPENPG
jgi:diguanylate cyclase (GGDEF)-like protein